MLIGSRERSKFVEMAEQNALKRNVLSAQVDLSKFNFEDSVFENGPHYQKQYKNDNSPHK